MTHQDTEDIIQIITSSGSDIDVVIVYRKSGIDQSKFEHKQKITTATTTSITLGVAQKVDILEINLFNIDASVSNDVTIQKYKSTTAYKIIKKTLTPSQSLNYAD